MCALRKGQMQSETTILSIFHYPLGYVLCTWITGLSFTPTEISKYLASTLKDISGVCPSRDQKQSKKAKQITGLEWILDNLPRKKVMNWLFLRTKSWTNYQPPNDAQFLPPHNKTNNQIWKRPQCLGYFSVSGSHDFSQEYCYILFLPLSSSFWITNWKTLDCWKRIYSWVTLIQFESLEKYLCMSLTSGLGTTHCLWRLTWLKGQETERFF